MMPPGQPSDAMLVFRRYWQAAGWALVLLIVYLSLTPHPVQVPVEQGDKFEHVFAYGALMSWFANLYEQPARRVRYAAGFIALGIGLEFVQRLTGYRSFEVADMAADAVGVAAGWLCAPPRMPNYLRWVEKFFRRT
jgi:VanZ family protein